MCIAAKVAKRIAPVFGGDPFLPSVRARSF